MSRDQFSGSRKYLHTRLDVTEFERVTTCRCELDRILDELSLKKIVKHNTAFFYFLGVYFLPRKPICCLMHAQRQTYLAMFCDDFAGLHACAVVMRPYREQACGVLVNLFHLQWRVSYSCESRERMRTAVSTSRRS